MNSRTRHTFETSKLAICCELSGPTSERSVFLLHGWPDDARTWDRVLPALHSAGWRTVVPYLRGFGPTRFRESTEMRTGQLSALGQDVIELADAMGSETFALVGHDWGARAAYIAAGLKPGRVTHCVSISVGYGTNDPRQELSLRQARNYWYHWYMALDRGEKLVRGNGKSLARFLWETWSPHWHFDEEEFEATAQSFDNPDWANIVLHSYRHRWGYAPSDPAYDWLERALTPPPVISVPTLVIHGGADGANDPSTSENRDSMFTGRYERLVLDRIGHFPQREASEITGGAITRFLAD